MDYNDPNLKTIEWTENLRKIYMKKIEAKIIADSINKQGNRITTMILTFPRFILAELNTHRMFSKNSASSRAIPFKKMIKMCEEDPFIPIAWQSHHSGMQGNEYITNLKKIEHAKDSWISASKQAILMAKILDNCEITKQLCNRLLEPFMWHTVLLTATEFDNFFNLRCPKYCDKVYTYNSKKDYIKDNDLNSINDVSTDYWRQINKSGAEIHMQALAESMWDVMNESTPKLLQPGEWHAPYQDKIDLQELGKITDSYNFTSKKNIEARLKICSSRCARLSYMTQDGAIDYQKDLELYDRLASSGHASPMEHICRVLTDYEYNNLGRSVRNTDGTFSFQKGWVDNFKGFISYRRILNFS